MATKKPPRPEVMANEILNRLSQVDEETRKSVLENLKSTKAVKFHMPGGPTLSPPPPLYTSWRDYLARTGWPERLRWCDEKAKKANRKRLLSDAPAKHVTNREVWGVVARAQGRCAYCGSLAVEKKPFDRMLRERTPWAASGRRIGSLGHRLSRFHGGGNHPDNLCWACLWCNTWVSEREMGAVDHGGLYPKDDGEVTAEAVMPPPRQRRQQPERTDVNEVDPDIWEMTGVEPGDGPFCAEYMTHRLFGPD